MTIPKKGELHLSKVKDAPDGLMGYFEAVAVPIGQDRQKRPITTQVIREVPEFERVVPPVAGDGPDETRNDPRVVRELAKAISNALRDRGADILHPTAGTVRAVSVGLVKQTFGTAHGGSPDAVKKAFGRAFNRACVRIKADVFEVQSTQYVRLLADEKTSKIQEAA
jgi:hypothetical protein